MALVLLATVTRPLTALDCGTQYSLETSMLVQRRIFKNQKIWNKCDGRLEAEQTWTGH